MKEEPETRIKLKLWNIAKEWLRTEHWEGNIESLINLILSFTEPRDKRITELEAQIEKTKYALNKIIKTVHNDYIDRYDERLIRIYDISCEVLQELEK